MNEWHKVASNISKPFAVISLCPSIIWCFFFLLQTTIFSIGEISAECAPLEWHSQNTIGCRVTFPRALFDLHYSSILFFFLLARSGTASLRLCEMLALPMSNIQWIDIISTHKLCPQVFVLGPKNKHKQSHSLRTFIFTWSSAHEPS